MKEAEKQALLDELAKAQTDIEMLQRKVDRIVPETPKPGILEEEWHYGWDNKPVHYNGGATVELCNWKREIAALPDVLRVLKMVEVAGWKAIVEGNEFQWVHLSLTAEEWLALRNALKKAGIRDQLSPHTIHGDPDILNKDNNCEHFKSKNDGLGLAGTTGSGGSE